MQDLNLSIKTQSFMWADIYVKVKGRNLKLLLSASTRGKQKYFKNLYVLTYYFRISKCSTESLKYDTNCENNVNTRNMPLY